MMSSVTLPSIDCCEPFFNNSASAQKNAAEEKKTVIGSNQSEWALKDAKHSDVLHVV